MDPAFKSRVDLTLAYSHLGSEACRKIWVNFVNNLPKRELELQDSEVTELAKTRMNGREIKSSIKTAWVLASTDKPLWMRDFKIVLDNWRRTETIDLEYGEDKPDDEPMDRGGEEFNEEPIDHGERELGVGPTGQGEKKVDGETIDPGEKKAEGESFNQADKKLHIESINPGEKKMDAETIGQGDPKLDGEPVDLGGKNLDGSPSIRAKVTPNTPHVLGTD